MAILVVTTIATLVAHDVDPTIRAGILAAAVPSGLVGALDDVRGLSPMVRLTLEAVIGAAALILLLDGLGGNQLWRVVFAVGCVLWMVSFVNAFNFMDGINGISAAQAVVAGGAFALIGTAEDERVLALGGCVIAAAAIGFAPYNFPVARVFLGDVGSYFVGAWLAALVVVGLRAGLAPEAVLAPLAVYLADTSTTIVRRVRAGEVWHEAHRSHVYQQLVAMGWSHARTTVVVAGFAAGCAALGAVALHAPLVYRVAADGLALALLLAYLASPSLLARRPGNAVVA